MSLICWGLVYQDDVRYRIPQAEEEAHFLERTFQATAIAPQPNSVRHVKQYCQFKAAKPIVLLNACQIGRTGYALTGVSGFAQAFLKGGAGAFIGTLWSVGDRPARIFSETLYTALLEGNTLSEATRKARKAAQTSGDATWLAYVVYGHPNLTITLQSTKEK
jgi:CHAT domain-containing protein